MVVLPPVEVSRPPAFFGPSRHDIATGQPRFQSDGGWRAARLFARAGSCPRRWARNRGGSRGGPSDIDGECPPSLLEDGAEDSKPALRTAAAAE